MANSTSTAGDAENLETITIVFDADTTPFDAASEAYAQRASITALQLRQSFQDATIPVKEHAEALEEVAGTIALATTAMSENKDMTISTTEAQDWHNYAIEEAVKTTQEHNAILRMVNEALEEQKIEAMAAAKALEEHAQSMESSAGKSRNAAHAHGMHGHSIHRLTHAAMGAALALSELSQMGDSADKSVARVVGHLGHSAGMVAFMTGHVGAGIGISIAATAYEMLVGQMEKGVEATKKIAEASAAFARQLLQDKEVTVDYSETTIKQYEKMTVSFDHAYRALQKKPIELGPGYGLSLASRTFDYLSGGPAWQAKTEMAKMSPAIGEGFSKYLEAQGEVEKKRFVNPVLEKQKLEGIGLTDEEFQRKMTPGYVEHAQSFKDELKRNENEKEMLAARRKAAQAAMERIASTPTAFAGQKGHEAEFLKANNEKYEELAKKAKELSDITEEERKNDEKRVELLKHQTEEIKKQIELEIHHIEMATKMIGLTDYQQKMEATKAEPAEFHKKRGKALVDDVIAKSQEMLRSKQQEADAFGFDAISKEKAARALELYDLQLKTNMSNQDEMRILLQKQIEAKRLDTLEDEKAVKTLKAKAQEYKFQTQAMGEISITQEHANRVAQIYNLEATKSQLIEDKKAAKTQAQKDLIQSQITATEQLIASLIREDVAMTNLEKGRMAATALKSIRERNLDLIAENEVTQKVAQARIAYDEGLRRQITMQGTFATAADKTRLALFQQNQQMIESEKSMEAAKMSLRGFTDEQIKAIQEAEDMQRALEKEKNEWQEAAKLTQETRTPAEKQIQKQMEIMDLFMGGKITPETLTRAMKETGANGIPLALHAMHQKAMQDHKAQIQAHKDGTDIRGVGKQLVKEGWKFRGPAEKLRAIRDRMAEAAKKEKEKKAKEAGALVPLTEEQRQTQWLEKIHNLLDPKNKNKPPEQHITFGPTGLNSASQFA